MNARWMKSKGGAWTLWVPPSSVSRLGAVGDHQRREYRLQDERRAAGRADAEGVVAGRDLARLERKILGADSRALDPRAADFGGGRHGRQVLTLQAGLLAPRAHALDAEGLARDERERQGRADNLSAALTE